MNTKMFAFSIVAMLTVCHFIPTKAAELSNIDKDLMLTKAHNSLGAGVKYQIFQIQLDAIDQLMPVKSNKERDKILELAKEKIRAFLVNTYQEADRSLSNTYVGYAWMESDAQAIMESERKNEENKARINDDIDKYAQMIKKEMRIYYAKQKAKEDYTPDLLKYYK